MSRINDIWQRKPSGLVIGFDFSGERITSPTGHSGTLVGDAAVAPGTRYLAVDGTGDYLNCGDDDAFSFGNGSTDVPFSVAFWLYQTSDPGGTAVEAVSKYSSSANVEWIFSARYGSSGPRFACYKNGSYVNSIARLGSGVSIGLNTWVHWCGTYSGSKTNGGLKIFKNSTQVDNTNSGEGTYTGMSNTTGILAVGRGTTGRVADVRIYNRELAQPEIAQIYNAGSARIAAGGTP